MKDKLNDIKYFPFDETEFEPSELSIRDLLFIIIRNQAVLIKAILEKNNKK